ncbi:MAG: hypothetical protein ACUZ8N_08230 [Candidatus Scalindua sp.]
MPIYEVIESKIKQCGLGNKTQPYSYKNEVHFKKLWEFDSSLSNNTIVIVWDGIAGTIPEGVPGSLVDTNKYLTPIDWAVGYSLSIKDRIERSSCPDLKILIYDAASNLVSYSDSLRFVYQSSNMDVMSMPWIRIFSKEYSGSGRDINAFYRQFDIPRPWWKRIFSAKVTENNAEALPSMREAFKQKAYDLDSIKRIWAASITRPSTPGDHHAIANLVGPLLLIKECGDLHINALQTLMRSIGLLPECKKGDASKKNEENAKALLGVENSWIDWEEPGWEYKLSELLKNSSDKLKLILIDDMFQISWGKILCRAVGVDYKEPSKDDRKDQLVEISEHKAGKDEKIVVKAGSSAEWILKKLEKIGDNKDKRFEFSLDNGVDQEILFLDLRLYSGNSENEVAFFTRLIALARKFTGGEQHVNLPWPGITNTEISEIQKWIENPDKKQKDPPGYIEALSLLPRILALTDLSLPIVLFSSTGRRDITEKLKPYGNIITVFEKPRFTVDIPLDIAWQTKCKFKYAMKEAFTVLVGRQICRKVKKLAGEAESSAVMIPVEINIPKFEHIEIYIDESGSPEFWSPDKESFAVGGLIMAYSQYDHVNELSNELKNEGCYWYSNDTNDKSHLSKTPGKQNEYKGACANTEWKYGEVRRKLLKLCSKKMVFVSGICVQEKMDDIKTKPVISEERRHILLNDDQGDERYKRLLTELLTLAIYEYIPELIGKSKNEEEKIMISIFAGTRTIPIQAIPGLFKKHNPDDYFGYGYNDKISRYYTIAASSIHPIVANILRNRKDLCKAVTFHHARGVYLKYGVFDKGDLREKYYFRTQHYFADHVLQQGGINDADYKEEFELGFNTQSNKDTVCLLDARKELLDDNIAEGIIRTARCNSKVVKDKMCCHLLRKIGESLKPEHFDGSDFLNICDTGEGDTGEEGASIGKIPEPEDNKKEQASTVDRSHASEKKQTNDRSKIDDTPVKLKDGVVNMVKPQAPEKTVVEEAKPRVIVIVKRKKKIGSKVKGYVCEETSGEKRRILVELFAKKASGINVMETGDIFEVTTYTKEGTTLYGAELRRIDDKG